MPGAPPHALFRALWEVGLDRGQLSLHEMLTDILEVAQVAAGSKPAHLAGQGEGAAWRIGEFARIAAAAGLKVLRTAPLAAPEPDLAGEFPAIAAAMQAGAARAERRPDAPQVLWIVRDPALAEPIGRLVVGDVARVPQVLGYPCCCAQHEARSAAQSVRALLRLYAAQHGLQGEEAVLDAIRAGLGVRPGPAAAAALEGAWRTRLAFPYLGYTACPACLARPRTSPSAGRNRRARILAFRLDEGFAVALWRTALGEAALATRGDFRALDPAPADPCPCGSGSGYGSCCAGRRDAMPEFR
jgi:hypothetical protein